MHCCVCKKDTTAFIPILPGSHAPGCKNENERNPPLCALCDYQRKAHKTAIYPKELRILYPVLGLCGETGELAEKIKKVFRDDGGIVSVEKKEQVAKELGDIMWYLAEVATSFGLTLGGIAELNLAKLAKRKEQNTLSGSGDNR